MVTIPQIIEYLEKVIAADFLAGNRAGLRRTQTAAGVLMDAAQSTGDKETAMRFRVLAAQAANKNEELDPNDN